MAKKVLGTCHLCGAVGPLSFEHVPPKKAFNNHPVALTSFEDSISLGPDASSSGVIQQQGMGGYTLCERCNSRAGGWYVRRFIDWCYQGMHLLERSGGRPTLYYAYNIAPLAVLKQIVMMFFSVNPVGLAEKHPELTEFLLNKERQYLDPQYRFYVYYNVEGQMRALPMMGVLRFSPDYTSSHMALTSEISYPPFGYVFTIDLPRPPNYRLVDISHFARYEWGRITTLQLRLPTLPTHLAMPADYRTKKEIYEEAAATETEMASRELA